VLKGLVELDLIFFKDIACLWLEFHEFEALTETNKSLNSVIRLFGIKMSVVTIT